jgi:hypothetical protein
MPLKLSLTHPPRQRHNLIHRLRVALDGFVLKHLFKIFYWIRNVFAVWNFHKQEKASFKTITIHPSPGYSPDRFSAKSGFGLDEVYQRSEIFLLSRHLNFFPFRFETRKYLYKNLIAYFLFLFLFSSLKFLKILIHFQFHFHLQYFASFLLGQNDHQWNRQKRVLCLSYCL